MASIDLSRSAYQPEKRYTSVRLQQGRVILDDDWNESEAITVHERVESLTDVIGASGTSDDGLRVSNVVDAGGSVDFEIGAGTFYLGGRRLQVDAGGRYLFQPDLFDPADVATPAGDRTDLVWVEMREVPITSVEDAELREVGLGGPDTAARTRLLAEVHVEADVDDDCEAAFEGTVGADVDERGVLATEAELTVGFVVDSTPGDLCSPAVTGGYLAHLNQAIRVQVVDDDSFVWGFDNAAPLYRVELLAGRQGVRFRTLPADELHRPRAGQVVELLPWSSVLPNGEVQAGATGALAVVHEPFDPDTDELTFTAVVPDFGDEAWIGRPDEAELEADGRWVFLRAWERGDDTSGPTLPLVPGGAAVPLGTTGLEVAFTGTDARPGDHWIIAARPAEPTQVVPWNFAGGRRPHGPVRLRAALALIRWVGGVPSVHDCRRRFRPLTEQQGCCEISVGDGSRSFGDVESIQDAIDALPPEGGRICVRPGTYAERILISGKHDVQIHGCGPDTVIAPDHGTGPVVGVDDSERIELRSLAVHARGGEGVLVGAAERCRSVRLVEVDVEATPLAAGIRVTSPSPADRPSRWIAVRGCTVRVGDLDAPPPENEVIELVPAVVLQGHEMAMTSCRVFAGSSKLTGALGGVQVAGLSEDVLLALTTIEGGSGNGITLGSIGWTTAEELPGAVGDYVGWAAALALIGWLVWFDGGCIQVGSDPPRDDDDDEPPLIPVSIGSVERVRITGCEIRGMGADGIGVARFFEPVDGEQADIITVDHLLIDDNRIVDNRRVPHPQGSPALERLSGHGGIALAAVTDLQVRHNSIVGNGPTDDVPTCGVFVLSGEAVVVKDNDVVDNGADPSEGRTARIGNRGGIVVRTCRPASIGAERLEVPEIAALVVHDNRVSQPVGQAIWANGHGAMSVRDNQLIAGNLGLTDIIAAALTLLDGNLDDIGTVAAVALPQLVGSAVTLVNLGLPIDLRALRQAGDGQGPAPDLGGLDKYAATMLVVDDPEARALHAEAAAEETKVGQPTAAVDGRLAVGGVAIKRLLSGGHVGVSDNQITLDLVDGDQSFALCSVLALTLDDLAFHDNQLRCVTDRDLVLVDAVALALWTARVSGNRFQEMRPGRAIGGSLGTLASLLSLSIMNTTTGNQMSGPYFSRGAVAALTVDEHNLVWP